MKKAIALGLTVAIVVTIIVVTIIVVIVLYRKKKGSEGFKKCICNSRNEQNCQDSDLVQDMYEKNKLTEYSNLKSKGWQSANESPGSMNYPVSHGCPWPNEFKPEWKAWDFTDFVG